MNLSVGPMNKEEIVDILNKYGFAKDEYIVLSTGALILLGIKDKANDIDLAVSKNLYDRFLKEYNCECSYTSEVNGQVFNVYSFDVFDFGLNYFDRENIEIVEGIPIQSIEAVLKLKRDLGREKDLKDIKLIEEYCGNNGR